jgi:cob(I)alamin adenosyltransferase
MDQKNMLHLITGEGKGKTSAAMGMALRMLGHEEPVLIAQFMKDGKSGEIHALRRFPLCHIFEDFKMDGFAWRMSDSDIDLARASFQSAVQSLEQEVERIKPGLLVLDELNVCLAINLLNFEDAQRLVQTGLRYADVVVTGRYAGARMEAMADYISVIAAKKHPFDEGQPARVGIEW